MQELRKHTRVNLDRAILIQLSNGDVVQARLADLSVGGLGVLYPAPAEVGSVLALHFQIPDDQDQPVTIRCQGIVRHVRVRGTNFISGFEFNQISDADRRVIALFINRKRATMQLHMVS